MLGARRGARLLVSVQGETHTSWLSRPRSRVADSACSLTALASWLKPCHIFQATDKPYGRFITNLGVPPLLVTSTRGRHRAWMPSAMKLRAFGLSVSFSSQISTDRKLCRELGLFCLAPDLAQTQFQHLNSTQPSSIPREAL